MLVDSCQALGTFEFLFSWQSRTFLLTENQRTLLRSQCSYIAKGEKDGFSSKSIDFMIRKMKNHS